MKIVIDTQVIKASVALKCKAAKMRLADRLVKTGAKMQGIKC